MNNFDFMASKKNVNRQGTKILHDIVSAYERGVFDDPQQSAMFCSLLACICEGKVKGDFDEVTATIRWSLTRQYSKELEKLETQALEQAKRTGNVVSGPWPAK